MVVLQLLCAPIGQGGGDNTIHEFYRINKSDALNSSSICENFNPDYLQYVSVSRDVVIREERLSVLKCNMLRVITDQVMLDQLIQKSISVLAKSDRQTLKTVSDSY